eukprot:9373889-Pyramimonas_sp.AAC.1
MDKTSTNHSLDRVPQTTRSSTLPVLVRLPWPEEPEAMAHFRWAAPALADGATAPSRRKSKIPEGLA